MIYLGTLGRMVGIKCPSSQNVEPASRHGFDQTLEGRIKAQVRSIGRRTWSLQLSQATTPEDHSALSAFASGAWGRGPFVFVPVDAPFTNLLTPDASTCRELTGHAGISFGGPVRLSDGTWASGSLVSDDPEAHIEIFAGKDTYPVIAGQPVTASAWISAGPTSPAYVRLYWIDSSGQTLGANASRPVLVAQGLTRASVTMTPPAGAVGVKVVGLRCTRFANAALTWTSKVQPWSDGQGCVKAVVSEFSRDQVMAVLGSTYSSVSCTVTEVG